MYVASYRSLQKPCLVFLVVGQVPLLASHEGRKMMMN